MIVRARKNGQIVWTLLNIKNYQYDYVSISVGAFDPLIFVFWLFGKRCVRVWIGTDVYKCKFWDYRVRAKLLSYFCENITVAPWLTKELNKYGIKAETVKHEYIVLLSNWIPQKS